MSLTIPAKPIRKAIRKHFRYRANGIICLTESQFNRKWDSVVWEISKYGYRSELLESFRTELLSHVAWIIEEETKRGQFDDNKPDLSNHKPIETLLTVRPVRHRDDGYDILREKPKPLAERLRNKLENVRT